MWEELDLELVHHCNISVLTWLFLKNCPLNIKCNILDTNHNLYVKPNLLAAAV